jgi:hypothetical protein
MATFAYVRVSELWEESKGAEGRRRRLTVRIPIGSLVLYPSIPPAPLLRSPSLS